MGKLQPAEYYDKVYKDSVEYNKHWSESAYLPLWEEVIKLIPSKDQWITELGCGVGQFGEMLKDRDYKEYAGYDYSKVAIEMAKKKGLMVYQKDLLKPFIDSGLIIALEIFEHTDDMKILSNITKETTIIFSVPDFDDPAHIRHFTSTDKVIERYSKQIDLESVRKYDRWYLGKGVKK